MKKPFFRPVISFFTIILLLSSCFFGPSIKGNGKVEKEKRSLDDFSKIKASNGLDVYLVPDTNPFVIVEADENLFNSIETEVSGNVLKIFTHERIRWASSKKVFVHYTELEEVKSNTGSMVYTDGTLKSRSLELAANTGSQQKMELICKRLEAKSSTGSHITLSGRAEQTDLKASTGAHLNGAKLSAKDCDADVSSGAHIYIEVNGKFNAEASSGGHVYYTGNPTQIHIDTSSGGQVKQH